MDNPRHIELLEKALDRQLAWIESANARTGLVSTLSTAMLGLLAALSPARGSPWTWLQVWLPVVVATALVLCLLMCAIAVLPKTRGPADSLIFFGHIAGRPRAVFTKAALARTDAEYLTDLAEQVHVNASIASRKFLWVQRAMRLFFLIVVPWVVAIYILYKG